jgi:plastocyanin
MQPATIRIIALAAAATAATPSQAQQNPAADAHVEIVTVHLSNFAFDPEHLKLKVGVPARLRLQNDSNGGHNFSAPAFFAASSPLRTDGEVNVPAHQTVELTVVPNKPGAYRLDCTHFLHGIFGMHGAIDVVP